MDTSPNVLDIRNLQVSFGKKENTVIVVKDISCTIPAGKITALVGESGSGKSVTALSILGLLPESANIKGEILFKGTDLLKADQESLRQVRGNQVSMIFQEPMTSLNPLFTCGDQVTEAIRQHQNISKQDARQQATELFSLVELPDPAGMLDRYPHQLSGGQKQRVMIAMAISCNPSLIIADEPTTALDVRVQKNIMSLLLRLQREQGMSVLLITHDLGLVADIADKTIVMFRGNIVEEGETREILANPREAYTRALLACRPAANKKGEPLPVVSDFMGAAKEEIDIKKTLPAMDAPAASKLILDVQDLSVTFKRKASLFGKTPAGLKAVDHVSFQVFSQETVALVGESGCGKTTLGRAILQLIKPDTGKIILEGKDLARYKEAELRKLRKEMQVVFQDPYGSLNPRITIGDAITEPLKVHGLYGSKAGRKERAAFMLEQVDMKPDQLERYPHQFSGGQRQRICIARALALSPSFLVFDESVSALDVSVQAQVLNLINRLKAEMKFTSLFISHDLSVVHYISDRILVMKAGQIIESGDADQVYFHPQHLYTIELIESIPGKRRI